MMKKQVWTGLFILTFFISQAFSQKKAVLSPDEFGEQVSQPDIQLLDVRTAEEYRTGHLIHSLQADWQNDKQFKERARYLDKARPVYLYCGSGVRSRDAARWLRNNGFKHVFELQKGIMGWKKSNKPVEADNIVKQINAVEYRALVNSASTVLIDFGAKWCPPCKKMEPVLDELLNELNGKFTLQKVDGGVHTDIMQQLEVEELPTFIVYQNGREVWRKQGLVSLEELKSQIQQNNK
jgi:thioredoxin